MLKPSNMAALALLAAIAANTVNAADKVADQDKNTLVTVNNIAIPQARLDLNIKALMQQGQPDSPDLRKKIKDDLIDLEVIAQEALSKKLDKQPEVAQIIEITKQNILRNAFAQDYVKNHPIAEDVIKQEYETQKKAVMGRKEYKVAHILVTSEKEAKAISAALKNKASFDKLAKEKSIDPSNKAQGGQLGWTDPSKFVQPFGEAIIRLNKGQISAPVQTQYGWHIIKLDDIRAVQIPAYEEIRASMEKHLQQLALQDAVKALRHNADIK